MRLVALFSVATLAALGLQTTVPHWIALGALVPDLALILAVDLGLRHHGAIPAVMAFAIGYATDALSGTQLGLNAVTTTLVFFFAYELSRVMIARGNWAGAATVFVGVLIKSYLGFLIGSHFAAFGLLGAITPAVLLQAAITAVLAPPIFSLLAAGKRLLGLPMKPARE